MICAVLFGVLVFYIEKFLKHAKAVNDENMRKEEAFVEKFKNAKQGMIQEWVNSLPIHQITPEMLVSLSINSSDPVMVSRQILLNLLAKATAAPAPVAPTTSSQNSFSMKQITSFENDKNSPFYTTKYGRKVKRVVYS
jgi:hypothetical protein